jgi:hypothetical protein
LGFQQLLEVEGEDGLPRGVWHRPPDATKLTRNLRVKISDLDELVARLQYQHEIAAQLYCHEDGLNWVKVGSFFTLLVLLSGLYSFFWTATAEKGHSFSDWDVWPIGLAVVFGVLIHQVFRVSLKSGINYMMTRKNAVIDLERRLSQLDGNLVPLVLATTGMSPTVRVLGWFPTFSLVVWIIASILLIARALGLKLY